MSACQWGSQANVATGGFATLAAGSRVNRRDQQIATPWNAATPRHRPEIKSPKKGGVPIPPSNWGRTSMLGKRIYAGWLLAAVTAFTPRYALGADTVKVGLI